MMNGILNIYKEKGYTSHDVGAKLRGIVKQKKIGHTGTLDPDAEGVLPVCLGKATKVCDLLTDKNKTYETVLLLGKTTDTQDITGSVLKEGSLENITEKQILNCIESYVGGYSQIPPMYSALKVNGKKLYELARNGVEVERKPRNVMIYEIRILEVQLPRIRMEVTCSKGTYIRTLCHDIGVSLGCGGCMESLLRKKVGCFVVQDSIKLEEVTQMVKDDRLLEFLIPIDRMFSERRAVTVCREYQSLVYNGNTLSTEHLALEQSETEPLMHDIKEDHGFKENEQVRVYDAEGKFIAVYRYHAAECMFKVEKMFV